MTQWLQGLKGRGSTPWIDAARLSIGRDRSLGPHRLAFIRRTREPGFSIEDVRELFDPAGHRENPCAEIHQIAARQLAMIEGKITTLKRLRRELRDTSAACAGGALPNAASSRRYHRTDWQKKKRSNVPSSGLTAGSELQKGSLPRRQSRAWDLRLREFSE